jgi:YHS domain-containing protein
MNKFTVAILGVILVAVSPAFAQESSSAQQSVLQPVTVGNKHCPVTGEEVGKMGPPLTFEYKGKVYNICCPGCKNTFLSDPEKYSKIAEDDAQKQK